MSQDYNIEVDDEANISIERAPATTLERARATDPKYPPESASRIWNEPSITSSINDYMLENGRRYHVYYGADKYPMPTDEIEHSRLDMQHEVLMILLDGQFFKAPIGGSPKRILDVGAGTGIWAVDVADLFPDAEVTGTDLSPTEPMWVPPNCHFLVDDAEKEWIFEPNHFDFIHARNIAQAIKNWPCLLSNMFRCTVPGGYVELVENGGIVLCDDGTMKDDNLVKKFFERMAVGMEKIGRLPYVNGDDLKEGLQTAGFVDVTVHRIKFPMAPWPKDKRLKQVGAMNLIGCQTAFHAYGMAVFTRVLGISDTEADKMCREAFQSLHDKDVHSYIHLNVVYGKKPYV